MIHHNFKQQFTLNASATTTEPIAHDENKDKMDLFFLNFNIYLMAAGLLGNILSVYVFVHRKLLVHKCNWYLLLLTLFELVFCVVVLTDYLFNKFNAKFLHDYNNISCTVIDLLIHTSDLCSNIVALFLSLDRLYAIKNPLKIHEFVTHLHAKKLIFTSLLILIFIRISTYLFCLNVCHDSYIIYCSIISSQIFNTIPILIILILNGLLIKELLSYFRNRSKSGDINELTHCIQKNKLNQTQKFHYFLIVFLNIYYLLSSIPYYSLITYLDFVELHVFLSNLNIDTIMLTQIITSSLFNSNHCINFFIYLIFHADFKFTIK